jgi:hypothetical protein
MRNRAILADGSAKQYGDDDPENAERNPSRTDEPGLDAIRRPRRRGGLCTWNPSGKPIARTIAPSDANALRHPTAPISAAAAGGSAIAPTAPTVINTAKAVPTALVKPRCQGA